MSRIYDDNSQAIHPNALEVCDGIDNNCDGDVDEGFPLGDYWPDEDEDGFGDGNVTATRACSPDLPGGAVFS